MKGMIKAAEIAAARSVLDSVDAGITASFPSTLFPMDFPTLDALYTVEPIPLTGGGFSSTTSLFDREDGDTTKNAIFQNAWEAEWLPALVLGLVGWANGARTELTNHWPDMAGLTVPFLTRESGFDRKVWRPGRFEDISGGPDQTAMDRVSTTTAGRAPMGVDFDLWGFTSIEFLTLEDSNEYPVITWDAGDLTPIDGFEGETWWEIRAKAAQARAEALLGYWMAHGSGREFGDKVRIWREGRQSIFGNRPD